MNEELEEERNFDQACLDTLVRLGMEEKTAVHFLGGFLNQKTGLEWTLIQIGGEESPKFFVPSRSLRLASLKN